MSIVTNKYSKVYFSIIEKAKAELRSKKFDYYEQHHIIPKSLGGSDRKTNLVLLTAREHYVVHLLLVRCVGKNHVYKMIAALARFKKHAVNSNSYNLYKTTMSKFSKGEYNSSHNKSWVHNTLTKEIKYVDKNKLLSMGDEWVKGLPYQRGGYTSDYIWMNRNGERTVIHKNYVEEFLSQGWILGRDVYLNDEHYQKMSRARHTREKDLAHSENLSGRIAMRKFDERKVIRVRKDQVNEMLKQGYILHRDSGMKMITSSGRKCSVNGVIYNSVSEASKLLNENYQRIIRKIKNKKYTEYYYIEQ